MCGFRWAERNPEPGSHHSVAGMLVPCAAPTGCYCSTRGSSPLKLFSTRGRKVGCGPCLKSHLARLRGCRDHWSGVDLNVVLCPRRHSRARSCGAAPAFLHRHSDCEPRQRAGQLSVCQGSPVRANGREELECRRSTPNAFFSFHSVWHTNADELVSSKSLNCPLFKRVKMGRIRICLRCEHAPVLRLRFLSKHGRYGCRLNPFSCATSHSCRLSST